MNPNTGAIATFENVADAQAAGHTVPHNTPDPSGKNRATRRGAKKKGARMSGIDRVVGGK